MASKELKECTHTHTYIHIHMHARMHAVFLSIFISLPHTWCSFFTHTHTHTHTIHTPSSFLSFASECLAIFSDVRELVKLHFPGKEHRRSAFRLKDSVLNLLGGKKRLAYHRQVRLKDNCRVFYDLDPIYPSYLID